MTVVLPHYQNKLSQKLYKLDIIIMILQIRKKKLFILGDLPKTETIKTHVLSTLS